jgi:hypothetical protein
MVAGANELPHSSIGMDVLQREDKAEATTIFTL